MDKQVTVAFHIARIIRVKVNEVSVECQSRVVEEKCPSRCESMRKVWVARGYISQLMLVVTEGDTNGLDI